MLTNRPLTSKQQIILRLIYRFRFITSDQLQPLLQLKDKNKVNQRLRTLTTQEYIGKRYKPQYKLQGRPAEYFLLNKGVKALRDTGDPMYDSSALYNARKDRAASERFIKHSTAILGIFVKLRSQYGDDLRFFTNTQLKGYDHYPIPLPDAYIRLIADDNEQQFFVEVLSFDQPIFKFKSRLTYYSKYIDDGEWDITNTEMPAILLICDNQSIQKRISRFAYIVDDADKDMRVYTVLKATFLSSEPNAKIWQNLINPDDVRALADI